MILTQPNMLSPINTTSCDCKLNSNIFDMKNEDVLNKDIKEILNSSSEMVYEAYLNKNRDNIQDIINKDNINKSLEMKNYYFVKKCFEKCKEWNIEFKYDESLIHTAIKNKHKLFFEWTLERLANKEIKVNDRFEITSDLINKKNLETVFKLKKNGIDFTIADLLNISVINNRLDIIEWLYENKNDFNYTHETIDNASNQGNLNILEWFWGMYKRDNLEFKYTEMSVNNASKKGHLNIIKWFWERRNEIPFKYTETAVDNAAHQQNLDIIQWFFDRYKMDNLKFKYTYIEDISSFYDEYMYQFDTNHYVLKWFWKNRKEIPDGLND